MEGDLKKLKHILDDVIRELDTLTSELDRVENESISKQASKILRDLLKARNIVVK